MHTPRKLPGLRNRDHDQHSVGHTIAVGIPHDRYTVAFHLDTCQISVIDTDGRDDDRGPYPSSRQAWMIANDLNTAGAADHQRQAER